MHSKTRSKKHKTHSKKRFTPDEDRIIKALVNPNIETNWSFIAKSLEKRTARQCRDRWFNYLDPSLNRDEWLPEEDEILVKLFEQKGPQWKFFTIILNGRSINDVRNRYFKLLRKSQKFSKSSDVKDISIQKKEIQKPSLFQGDITKTNIFDNEIFSNFDSLSFDLDELLQEFDK